jgi:hypothetical protein
VTTQWHGFFGGLKVCARCRQRLPVSAFRPNPKLRSGLHSWCRGCCRVAARESRVKYRDRYNERRRIPPTALTCVECGAAFEGRKDRLICGLRRCKDRRYARLHPEQLRAKEARKYQRRKKALAGENA